MSSANNDTTINPSGTNQATNPLTTAATPAVAPVDTTTINPASSGFPPYLDFTKLRTNAINYLGPITSKFWTDYNIHDPGITTLEVLMYAIMDLGYRANLPIGSLLASPAGTPDSNFFTAAEILACNPTTILDNRKLLMDIGEVRNAWLETDQSEFNGLYRIYIELDRDLADFATHAQWEGYKDKVRAQIKRLLHAHRNLCEDFESIRFLQKRYIGVSADIELAPGTTPAAAYQALVASLYDFFSPTPSFYTLSQLTTMGVSLDTVFEGRPHTGLSSHGFLLDEDMPDRPVGGAPIYLSKLYQQMLAVSGIRTVRRLQLLDAAKGKPLQSGSGGEWTFPMPDDAIPFFSVSGSAFNWYQNGQLITTSLSSLNSTLQMNAAHTGKVLYSAGPPALDAAIPNAAPLIGLSDYYSIQNDFPKVYGIGDGGLPATASRLRQSQAYQFKGYLLFFDQLLADYLAQLGNLRNVFSMFAPTDQTTVSTYPHGDLSTVPGLLSLQRFPTTDTADIAISLMTPVSAKAFNQIIVAAATAATPATTPAPPAATAGTGKPAATPASSGSSAIPIPGAPAATAISTLTPYSFTTSGERDTVVETLTVLFTSMPPALSTLQQDDGSWIYYLSGIQSDFILISRNSFASLAAAQGEATTVLYIAGNKDNYNLISLAGISSYTFTITQTSASYYNYLQSILEDPDQYTERRTAFLQHLMSRFAETFTDYAMLSAGFLSQQQIANDQVSLMQQFLRNLPALGAERGKAFDYRLNGWDNENTSGFEKRFKAYCGIPDWHRHYLCNFEVHKYEDKFNVKLTLAGQDLFTCSTSLQEQEALPAAASLFRQMASSHHYRPIYREKVNGYGLEVYFFDRLVARSLAHWPDEPHALAAAGLMANMWRLRPHEEDCWVSEYEYRPELVDHQGRVVRSALEGFSAENAAHDAGVKLLRKINDPAEWTADPSSEPEIGKLYPNQEPDFPDQYIDADGFRIYTQKDVVGKPGRYSFDLLDLENTFKFRSKQDFASDARARSACHQLLHIMTVARHYHIRKDRFGESYKIVIRAGGDDLATSETEWTDEYLAREMIDNLALQLRRQLYTLRVMAIPFRWRFHFRLGLPDKGHFTFASKESFVARRDAMDAAEVFHKTGPYWRLTTDNNEIVLEPAMSDGRAYACLLLEIRGDVENPGLELADMLLAKEQIYRITAGEEAPLREQVILDAPSKQGNFVYRLVDKDHPYAFHPAPHDHHPSATHPSATHPAGAAEAAVLRDELILKGRKGYNYLEVCLGGDNIRLDQDSGLYYYQVKCRNDYFKNLGIHYPGGELPLFESYAGFATADAAQQAFGQAYLDILEKARRPDNYGDRKFIGLLDRTVPSGDMDGKSPTVLVPAATRDVFSYAALDIVGELVRAALTYPVRMAGRTKYEFILMGDNTPDWISAARFTTPSDAQVAFDFFRLLLNYPGNYFIDYDWTECRYRIGVREVLAESTATFPHEEAAWGPGGVEKFIGIAQSAGGFHLDMRKDCTYSFFAACRNRKAIHPCEYETALQRDKALQGLFEAARNFSATSPTPPTIPAPDPVEDQVEILNQKGQTLAYIPLPDDNASDEEILNRILDLQDAVWAGAAPAQDADGLYFDVHLTGAAAFKVRPAAHFTEKEWLKELLEAAAYFPIIRDNMTTGAVAPGGTAAPGYRVAIKLPGFVDLPGELRLPKDCGCPPAPAGVTCYLAWESERAYPTAAAAWTAMSDIWPLLLAHDNYRPVFGPQTGVYRIELHEKHSIVARNPQPYSYPAMDIDALDRARNCINAEGLDLVEHLLLRPDHHTKPDHIEAPIPVCDTVGPCAEPLLPFNPGTDPYSFLLTVALPAWPARFRQPQNRVLLESILQREAPAHILPRILWLTPRDMCRFEGYYEGWLNTLGREANNFHPCGHFDPAKFIGFLFSHSFGCLPEFTECDDHHVTPTSTATPASITKTADDWLSQINLLYCWKDRQCADTQSWFKPPRQPDFTPLPAPEDNPPPTREDNPPPMSKTNPQPLTDERLIRRLIMTRIGRYQQKIEEWQQQSHEPELAGKAGAFLMDPEPSMKRFENLVREIMKDAAKTPGKRSRKSSAPHRHALAGIMISFYLDKATMDMGNTEKWEHLRLIVEELDIRIEEKEGFFTEWRADEMRLLVGDFDEDKIRSLIRVAGKTKK